VKKLLQTLETMAPVFETKPEEVPFVMIELDREYPVEGLEIVADSKDRQNHLRGLTVWTSKDRKTWTEIWHADPYHIAMGRDWLVNPKEVRSAKYIKVGLRPKSELQMTPQDERMKMGKYALRLNSIKVYAQK